MTHEQIKEYLKSKGWPARVCEAGGEGLVQRWKEFVTKVETDGYTRNWLIDDYWIFLETRELIHEIGFDERVAEADARFQALLTATNIKHRHQERNTDYDFWNFGYPRNAIGCFYEQIRTHILHES